LFSFEKISVHFNKNIVIKGFITALFFSAFIYLEYFKVENRFIYSISAILAIHLYFIASRATLFVAGFFIGLLWFYWIALSFRYYDLSYLVPFVMIGIGIFYAFIFLLLGSIDKVFVRLVTLYFVQYLHPFNFDWFNPKLMLVNSYFGLENIHFDFLLISVAIVTVFRPFLKPIAIIPLILAINYQDPKATLVDKSIYLVQTDLAQDKKWDKNNFNTIIKNNIAIIDKAIEDGYKIVVLPEVAFPTALNYQTKLLEILKEKSYQIGIVVGAMKYEDKKAYNSTYIFEDASLRVVDKHILVPFGEYVPLPKFFKDLINDIIYDGAEDTTPSSKPGNFMLKDRVYRNAICYEATSQKIYEDYPKYVIAISNNAWFAPSIQPTLQYILIKYYARRYNTIVYHSANISGTRVITP